jgi:outer membrane protein TolC
MISRRAATPSLTLLAAILMSGCAVSPTAFTTEALEAGARDNTQRVTAGQEPITGVIDLPQAMARALKYNLDHQVELYQAAVQMQELNLAHYSLLPSLVSNQGYAARNTANGSSSFNLVNKTNNFGFSTSQDERIRSSDLVFSWNVLDFGLSYVRARQAADKALVAEEGRRKVIHRLMEDVRTAYWRSYSAQKQFTKLRSLELRTKVALAGSRSLADDRTTSPITAITYRRELIEVQRTLRDLQRELSIAKHQLAALMNVAPGTAFTLTAPKPGAETQLLSKNPLKLVLTALENRPEIRDAAYRRRINLHEADAALLEMLPGIQLYAGTNNDSNSFLLNDQWLNWGAKASWNLLKVFSYPARRDLIEGQSQLLDQRNLALTMAIMTQVHVSLARIAHGTKELETAKAYHVTQQELLGNIRAEFAANRISEQTLLREELNAAVGEVRYDIAQASLESARGSLIAAMGLDPIVGDVASNASVAELTAAIRLARSTARQSSAALNIPNGKE